MLAAPENYKGINFVRISSLPLEQRKEVWTSFNVNLIIKILKDETLLNDCLEYKHYALWYDTIFIPHRKAKLEVAPSPSLRIAS